MIFAINWIKSNNKEKYAIYCLRKVIKSMDCDYISFDRNLLGHN